MSTRSSVGDNAAMTQHVIQKWTEECQYPENSGFHLEAVNDCECRGLPQMMCEIAEE